MHTMQNMQCFWQRFPTLICDSLEMGRYDLLRFRSTCPKATHRLMVFPGMDLFSRKARLPEGAVSNSVHQAFRLSVGRLHDD